MAGSGEAWRGLARTGEADEAGIDGDGIGRARQPWRGMARRGRERRGEARQTRPGWARNGEDRRGEDWTGVADKAGHGAARRGVEGQALARRGADWRGLVRQTWRGADGRGMARRGADWMGLDQTGLARQAATEQEDGPQRTESTTTKAPAVAVSGCRSCACDAENVDPVRVGQVADTGWGCRVVLHQDRCAV